MVVESSDVKGLGASSTQLQPDWRHWSQLGAKHLGHVVAVGVPLGGDTERKTRMCHYWPFSKVTLLFVMSQMAKLNWFIWILFSQVWHIPALVPGRFSWHWRSISSPPSQCLSSAGRKQPGLDPTQSSQPGRSAWGRQSSLTHERFQVWLIRSDFYFP